MREKVLAAIDKNSKLTPEDWQHVGLNSGGNNQTIKVRG